MTEVEQIRQRIERLTDRWRQHPDRIPADEACTQILAALDGPLPEADRSQAGGSAGTAGAGYRASEPMKETA